MACRHPQWWTKSATYFPAVSLTKKAQRLKCETLSLWMFCVSGFCWRSICLSVRMMCRMVASVCICVDLFQYDCHIHILKDWKTTDFLSQLLAGRGSYNNMHFVAKVRTLLFCPCSSHLFELVVVTSWTQSRHGVSLGRLVTSRWWQECRKIKLVNWWAI